MKQVLMVAALFGLLMGPSVAMAACSNPAGDEADQMYNGTHKVMQFCNGTDWIAMGALSPAAGGGGIDWTDCEHKQVCYADTTSNSTLSCDAGQPHMVSHACNSIGGADTNVSELSAQDCYLSGANSLYVKGSGDTKVCGSIKCCALQ